jgi:hypothetical protein
MAAASSYGSAVSWIKVADVSDPENPALLDQTPIPGVITGLEIVGNHAFVVGDSGMTVLDVSNPLDSPIVGSMDIPFGARDFEIVGDKAYIANPPGLVLADISNPLQPHILGSLPLGTSTLQVEGLESYAYLGTTYDFRIVDVSDPSNPIQVGTHPELYGPMEIRGNRLYTGYNSNLQILDLTNPIVPQLIQEISTSWIWISALDIADDKAYVAGNKLEIFDISSIANPVRLGTMEVTGPGSILVEGEYAFSGSGFGLEVINVSNPNEVPALGSLESPPSPPYAACVEMASGIAYIGSKSLNLGHGALDLVDVSTPSLPIHLGSLTTWEVLGVALSGSHAVLACGASGIRVVAVQDPTNPTIVGARNTPGYARDVEVLGSHALIADGVNVFLMMTIANPSNPQIVSSLTLDGPCNDVELFHDDLVLAAAGGLQVLDVSIPSSPLVVGSIDINPPNVTNVAVSESYAFVTSNISGTNHHLTVVDCANPSTPEEVSSIFLDGAGQCSIVGDVLYVNGADVFVFDISDPLNLRRIGRLDTGVVATDEEIVCTLSSNGLLTYPPQCGSVAVSTPQIPLGRVGAGFTSISPNPFGKETLISFAVHSSARIHLSIYDVAGRLVRNLADQVFPQGVHGIQWNGRDESQSQASPGVYLVRMETPTHREARRIVHVR